MHQKGDTMNTQQYKVLQAALQRAPRSAFVRSCAQQFARRGYLTVDQLKALAKCRQPLSTEALEPGAQPDVAVTARPRTVWCDL